MGIVEDGLLAQEDYGSDCFNCGGFALREYDWVVPETFTHEDEFSTPTKLLEAIADEIAEKYPEWERISRWQNVARKRTLMAFRIEASRWSRERYTDFHFVIRENGEWWHKMGGWSIERFTGAIRKAWKCDYLNYDSKIVWFVLKDEEV